LAERGIGCKAYYRVPSHLQPAMAEWRGPELSLPGTDEAARTHLAIPMSPVLGADAAREVTAVAREVLAGAAA
jgi:dTDP-3-amino-3,4,6-trideoxy-alpha-D-glucose transaminase